METATAPTVAGASHPMVLAGRIAGVLLIVQAAGLVLEAMWIEGNSPFPRWEWLGDVFFGEPSHPIVLIRLAAIGVLLACLAGAVAGVVRKSPPWQWAAGFAALFVVEVWFLSRGPWTPFDVNSALNHALHYPVTAILGYALASVALGAGLLYLNRRFPVEPN